MKSSNILLVIFLSLNLLTISLVVNNVVTAPNAYSASPYGSSYKAASPPQNDQSPSTSSARSAAFGSQSNGQSAPDSSPRSAAAHGSQSIDQSASASLPRSAAFGSSFTSPQQ